MDDEEVVCPLCCEEMDMSDRQFYPCKCGYQVCMWCWHRIKEQETGLCPACRTPYGDNPHAFSAVDVEEVLKANKEKEAAAKRERQQRNQQNQNSNYNNDGTSSSGHHHHQQSDNAEATLTRLSNNKTTGRMDVPQDRQQLLGMRVIRRNLVYAVGLPPAIANEDLLRRPEYFGQYGKISKIVLNRGTPAQGRPATASAYVTFVHKDDTLACILALDGFFMEGRNVRASYGTSKYCSAFMRSMKCTNPECTYLHEMGDIEDTFTKAEIQAGYVTSGRDVLARQQQIVQQALSAASGASGAAPRKRVGGGGPSGTGRASNNPIFPAPTYDEPTRVSTAHLVPPVSTSSHRRSSTTSASIPSQQPLAHHGRSSSTGATAPGVASQVPRKSSIASAVSSGATAASVVAGGRSAQPQSEGAAPHTTLTPLTPLKRTNVTSKQNAKSSQSQGSTNQDMPQLPNMRTGPKKSNGNKGITQSMSSSPPNSETGSTSSNKNSTGQAPATVSEGLASIGGDVIATPLSVAPPTSLGEPLGRAIGMSAASSGPSIPIHNQQQQPPAGVPIPLSELQSSVDTTLGGLGGLGGEVFNGPLQSTNASKSAIGSSKDRWNSDPMLPGNLNGALFTGGSGSSTIGGSTLTSSGPQSDVIGGGVIGGGPIGSHGSGSSALASMLGINLPTGSGSLRESSSLWTSSEPAAAPAMSQPPISALNGNSVPLPGLIGGGGQPQQPTTRSGPIGGLPIGSGGDQSMTSGNIIGVHAVGGQVVGGGGGGSSSDIALLQSLLPGVHITSGTAYQNNGLGTIGGSSGVNNNAGNWNSGAGVLPPHGQPHQQNGFGFQSTLNGQPQTIGTIGQTKQRQAPGNIW